MHYTIGTGYACCSVIQTKTNEICYSYNDGTFNLIFDFMIYYKEKNKNNI